MYPSMRPQNVRAILERARNIRSIYTGDHIKPIALKAYPTHFIAMDGRWTKTIPDTPRQRTGTQGTRACCSMMAAAEPGAGVSSSEP
jgi:hypothetical protein